MELKSHNEAHEYVKPELVPLNSAYRDEFTGDRADWKKLSSSSPGFVTPEMEGTNPKTENNTFAGPPPPKEAQTATRKRTAWSAVWYDYANNTTLHGVNKIAERKTNIFRRLFWILVVLTGVSLFAYQMVNSLITFYDYPVTVNVKINYNSTLTFPAVTVCNQNDFRTTETARLGYYTLVKDYYASVADGGVNLSHYGASNLSLEELYRTSAHRKEDMIVNCTWDESPCDMDDFQTILTDYGVCYTFNSARSGQQVRNITRTGADRGLRLRLNIEQYEYMVGPNPGAGIKLLVHENTEVPLVRDLGQAIPPGTHSYVGIQIVQVNNLEKPYGECRDDQQLKYFEYYSIPACVLECKEDFLQNHCSCRDVYMPNGTGDPPAPPVCTLEQYQSCAVPKMVEFYTPEYKSQCDWCSIPCQRNMYDASVTYAYSSSFDTDQLLRDAQSGIRTKFLSSRETNQRVDPYIVKADEDMVTSFQRAVEEVDSVLHQILDDLRQTRSELMDTITDALRRGNFHLHWGLQKVKQTLEFNFVRGWEVRDERTFEHVPANFLEISSFLERALVLASAKSNETRVAAGDPWRNSLYLLAEHDLYAKHVLCIHSRDNLTDINDAYKDAKPIVTYLISPYRQYDQKYVTPLLTRTDKQSELYPKFMLRTNQFMNESDILRNLMREILLEGAQKEDEVHASRFRFEKAARSFLYYRFYYFENVIQAPVETMTEIIRNFESALENVSRDWQGLLLTLDSLLEFVGRVDDAWAVLEAAKTESLEYLNDKDKKKEPLARGLSSKGFANHLISLEQFFSEARSRSISLGENLRKLELSTSYLWETMLQEETVKKFYQAVKQDIEAINKTVPNKLQYVFYRFTGKSKSWVRQNYRQLTPLVNADFPDMTWEEKSAQLQDLFKRLINSSNTEAIVADKDSALFKTVDVLKESMVEFLQGNEINSDFFRNNFLNVDVFMKELSYQEIQQQVAYDGTSLFSDIGGSMGLFIGASVISMFELLDAVIVNFFRIHLRGNSLENYS